MQPCRTLASRHRRKHDEKAENEIERHKLANAIKYLSCAWPRLRFAVRLQLGEEAEVDVAEDGCHDHA